MGVTVTNLIAGPADLYVATFGGAEPADSAVATAPASAVWTDMGGTNDGLKLVIDQDFMQLEVDQLIDIPGSRRTKRTVSFETGLAEPTLANLKIALMDGTITASAAYQSFDPIAGVSAATQPTYNAFLFDGWAPAGFRRRVIIRRGLSVEGVKELAYKRDGQTFLPVKVMGHYVSASTLPFHIVDQLS